MHAGILQALLVHIVGPVQQMGNWQSLRKKGPSNEEGQDGGSLAEFSRHVYCTDLGYL